MADTLVVDVDLHSVDVVTRIRELSRQDGVTRRLVFVVDPGDHHAVTQANALGANMLIRSPLSLSDVQTLLFGAQPASAEVGQAVAGGAAALKELFGALQATTHLPAQELAAASTDIADAVGTHGLDAWLDTVRRHHQGTYQHCLIVTGVIASFGRVAGFSSRDSATLAEAGLLHDIGKVGIPLAILDKPAALSRSETQTMMQHPSIGFEYLKGQAAVPTAVLSSVLHHHEYLDGSGYPDGLSGTAIDNITRILTICDIFGAMLEERSYKPASRPEDALKVVQALAERGRLETALVRAFAPSVTAP